jgi:hypothetical protein
MIRAKMSSPTYWVIDTNMLQSGDLDSYLSANLKNFAVLPDHTSMEVYKSGTLPGVFESMAILSRFPQQVIVLKSTRLACGLAGSAKAARALLIDRDQTALFAQFCERVELARLGSTTWQRALLKRVAAARTDMDTFHVSIQSIASARKEIAALYSESERRAIRTNGPIPTALKEKFMGNIMHLARAMLIAHPEVKRLPDFDNLSSRYLLRFALCIQIWILEWIATGSPDVVKHEKITNDLLDLHIATCATYFDGLLSKDEKLSRIYAKAQFMLNQLT